MRLQILLDRRAAASSAGLTGRPAKISLTAVPNAEVIAG